MYMCFVKLGESRNSEVAGPLSFPTAEARRDYVSGPAVYWYHEVEEEDWMLWRRGGAWEATKQPGPADRVNNPPEITERDRWLGKVVPMNARELVGRLVKARIVSWLNSSVVGAVVPVGDGNGVVLAVYDNGRYVAPQMVQVPNDVGPLWGPDQPDGPATYGQHPKPPEENQEEEGTPDDTEP